MKFIFDHIVINVVDIDKMVKFYTEVLQLPGERLGGVYCGAGSLSLCKAFCRQHHRPFPEKNVGENQSK